MAGDWANGIVKDILHEEIYKLQGNQPKSVDLAQVLALQPTLTLRIADRPVTYTLEEVLWAFNPVNLQIGDFVLLNKDSDNRPIGVGILDAKNQDPTLHPKGEAIERSLTELIEQVRTWKGSVSTLGALPLAGNRQGDTRLVLDSNTLFRWEESPEAWLQIGSQVTTLAELEDVDIEGVTDGQFLGFNLALEKWVPLSAPVINSLDDIADVDVSTAVIGDSILWNGTEWVPGSPTDPTKLPLVGGTLTGNLFMSSGTSITLPDAPTVGSDAANKDYVDSVISSPNRVVVSIAANYVLGPTDSVILADSSGGIITITLPNVHSSGRYVDVKDRNGTASTNVIVIQPSGGDTVDGAASFSLTSPYQAVQVISDGTNWYIV